MSSSNVLSSTVTTAISSVFLPKSRGPNLRHQEDELQEALQVPSEAVLGAIAESPGGEEGGGHDRRGAQGPPRVRRRVDRVSWEVFGPYVRGVGKSSQAHHQSLVASRESNHTSYHGLLEGPVAMERLWNVIVTVRSNGL